MSDKASTKPKILIVDDDATSRITLKKIVGDIGEITLAENGESAIQLFRESLQSGNLYSLIFLDILMPGLSGHDVLDKIRESESIHNIVPGEGSKVIMVTSSDDESNIFESHVLGCEGYIVKPFSHAKIKEHLLELGMWPE